MSDCVQRISEYINYKGLNVKLVEREIGVSNSTLRTAIKDGKNIGSDKVEKFLQQYNEVSAEWLLRGEGSMIKNEVHLSDDSHKLENERLQKSIIRLVTENTQLRDEIEQLKNKKRAG